MSTDLKHIPVTILTGFLGAGKTTFLNHILKERSSTRFAIIENEFGEQGIDNELVIQPEETIVELNNGCLCCTLNDNLYDILNELHQRRDEFDEIIIEATGVADPEGLAQPFITHPAIKKTFPLTAIICLVDAEQIEEQLERTEEAAKQVAYSDVLLINKSDLVTSEAIEKLEHKLNQLNPLATVLSGQVDDYPSIEHQRNSTILDEKLLNGHHSHHPPEKDFPVQKPHSHHHHHHTDSINSVTLHFDRPFDLRKLGLHLSVFFMFQAKDVYRMKGIVWLDDEETKFVLQSVGARFNYTPYKNWEAGEARGSVLVFIGKNLKRNGLESMLRKCLVDI